MDEMTWQAEVSWRKFSLAKIKELSPGEIQTERFTSKLYTYMYVMYLLLVLVLNKKIYKQMPWLLISYSFIDGMRFSCRDIHVLIKKPHTSHTSQLFQNQESYQIRFHLDSRHLRRNLHLFTCVQPLHHCNHSRTRDFLYVQKWILDDGQSQLEKWKMNEFPSLDYR